MGRKSGEKSLSEKLQSIAGALSAFKRRELVEKCTVNRESHWRLKSLE